MRPGVCLHNVPDVTEAVLPDVRVVRRTTGTNDLIDLLGAVTVDALIIDLDQLEQIGILNRVSEVCPDIAIVGVSCGTDADRIIAAHRAGCTQFVKRPIDAKDLAAALGQALEQTHPHGADGPRGAVIGVFGASGGAGTTTIAAHLAVELSLLTEAKTILFDLDLEFGGVARAFDLEPRFTIGDLANSGQIDAALLQRATCALACGANIVGRPTDIEQAQAVDDNVVRQLVQIATSLYPYVLLDLPRRIDAIVGASFELADRLLIAIQPTVPSVTNADRFIRALGADGYDTDRVEIVINRYRKHLHTCTVEMIEKQLRRPALAVIPSDYAAVNRALDAGHPLGKRNPVRTAIAEMAGRLSGRTGGTSAPVKSNWLSGSLMRW